MADLRREGINNQKRGICVSVSDVLATSATMDDTLFNLPENSLVIAARAIVTTISGTATDTVDIKVGSTVIANEVVVGVAGVQAGTFVGGYFATGGAVSVVAGVDAPDAAGRIRIVIDYIELDKTTGEYTN